MNFQQNRNKNFDFLIETKNQWQERKYDDSTLIT